MEAQTSRGLLQNYGGAPPVPEVIDEIIDAINDGSLDPNNIPGIDVEQTDSQITVTVNSATPPTTAQLADIGNKVATSINIPGVAVSTKTEFGDDGSIVIYVFLGQAQARLVEYYSRMLAAQANSTNSARRSLLQSSSTANTRYAVIGEDKAQVERYRRELDKTLTDKEKMTEISNEVIEGSTAESEIIALPLHHQHRHRHLYARTADNLPSPLSTVHATSTTWPMSIQTVPTPMSTCALLGNWATSPVVPCGVFWEDI